MREASRASFIFVLPSVECSTPYTHARRAMQEKYLEAMTDRFTAPILQVPLLSHEVKGLDVLVELGEQIYGDGQNQMNISKQVEVVN